MPTETAASPVPTSPMILTGEPQPATEDRRWIWRAFVANLAIVSFAWLFIIAEFNRPFDVPVHNQIVYGITLMLVAVVSFFGFYLASPGTAASRDPWMRNAITAAFVMFYLVLLTLLITDSLFRMNTASDDPFSAPAGAAAESPEGAAPAGPTFGEEIFTGFTVFIAIVLGFYFAVTAFERVAITIQIGHSIRQALDDQQPAVAQAMFIEQQRTGR